MARLRDNNQMDTALVHAQSTFSGMISFNHSTMMTPFTDEGADPCLSALPEFMPLVQDQGPESPDFWPSAFPTRLLSRRLFC